VGPLPFGGQLLQQPPCRTKDPIYLTGSQIWSTAFSPCPSRRSWSAPLAFASPPGFRLVAGWDPNDVRFAAYVPAILATGLTAGVPAGVGTAVASILITLWLFVPPYFQFKWPDHVTQTTLLVGALTSLITIYFTYCCRLVLQRLQQREFANQVLAKELDHRNRNLLSVTQVIVQKSLADQPELAKVVVGRLKSVLRANELLTSTGPGQITILSLLKEEFSCYGEDRLEARGPEFSIDAETARQLLLLFHELATNAGKYGSLSCPEGTVYVEWRWNGSRRISLNWKEIGGPPTAPTTQAGFGSELIAICVQAVCGTFHSSFLPEGFACSITLRVAKKGSF